MHSFNVPFFYALAFCGLVFCALAFRTRAFRELACRRLGSKVLGTLITSVLLTLSLSTYASDHSQSIQTSQSTDDRKDPQSRFIQTEPIPPASLSTNDSEIDAHRCDDDCDTLTKLPRHLLLQLQTLDDNAPGKIIRMHPPKKRPQGTPPNKPR